MKCPECGYELDLVDELLMYKFGERSDRLKETVFREARKSGRIKRRTKDRRIANQLIGPGHFASVYFVKGGDYVKIGKAKDVEQRVRDLQVASPKKLKILYVIQVPESRVNEEERRHHEKFKHLKASGEWFRYDDEIKEYIASLHAAG